MNTYITPIEYRNANTGQETASLVGNLGRLSGSHAIGATSLALRLATTGDLYQDDQITLFDGASSEVVTVSADTAFPVTSIPLAAGTAYAHSDGTVYCSNGASGSLADDIIAASDMVEDQCIQSLFLQTRVDTLSLQTTEASVSNEGVLLMKPLYFPIQTVASITLTSGSVTTGFDATKASIELGQQIVKFYQLVPTSSTPTGYPYSTKVNQRTRGFITLTYASGFAYASMPPRVKKACVLLTSELLGRRDNRSGAIQVQRGKQNTIYGVRGDTTGESLLVKEAYNLLSSFTREAY